MMRFLKHVVLGAAMAFMAVSYTFAQDVDQGVFSVSGVAVDVSAQSASAARTIAHQDGQREAFKRLFQKLVAEEDWAFQPTLANEDLAPLIRGFDVKNERSSLTR